MAVLEAQRVVHGGGGRQRRALLPGPGHRRAEAVQVRVPGDRGREQRGVRPGRAAASRMPVPGRDPAGAEQIVHGRPCRRRCCRRGPAPSQPVEAGSVGRVPPGAAGGQHGHRVAAAADASVRPRPARGPAPCRDVAAGLQHLERGRGGQAAIGRRRREGDEIAPERSVSGAPVRGSAARISATVSPPPASREASRERGGRARPDRGRPPRPCAAAPGSRRGRAGSACCPPQSGWPPGANTARAFGSCSERPGDHREVAAAAPATPARRTAPPARRARSGPRTALAVAGMQREQAARQHRDCGRPVGARAPRPQAPSGGEHDRLGVAGAGSVAVRAVGQAGAARRRARRATAA